VRAAHLSHHGGRRPPLRRHGRLRKPLPDVRGGWIVVSRMAAAAAQNLPKITRFQRRVLLVACTPFLARVFL